MSKTQHTGERRDFLKKGLAGVAGFTLASTTLRADEETAIPEKKPAETKKPKVITRTLGRTGIELPVVSMGAVDNENLIAAALDAGIRHIDTAFVYMNGRHEEMIGKVIKGRPRDSFVIGTKVYVNFDQRTGLYAKDTDPKIVFEQLETSLQRLGLEYVEILYLHDVVKGESARFAPLLEALQKAKAQGKARYIGISTHTNEPEVINAAVDAKVYDVVLTAYNFRQPHRAEVQAAIKRAAKAGLGVVAMKTQAGGYWDSGRQEPINHKAALKWALSNEDVHTAIPSFPSFDQLELDLSVMEGLALSAAEKKDLRLDEPTKTAGLYCAQCRKCVEQCRHHVELPTMMRSYMYAHGYRDLAKAKNAVRNLELTPPLCASCDPCTVTDCTMGFNVKEKALDIARIANVPDDFIS
jgi:aryl-alcohol dehydrogenase-like predicted oxidoreductase